MLVRWRKATLGIPAPLIHDAVAKAIRRLGVPFESQFSAGYGLPIVDIVLPEAELAIQVIRLLGWCSWTGSCGFLPAGQSLQNLSSISCVVQIVSPGAHTINTNRSLGCVAHMRRVLQAAGWRVETIMAADVPSINNKPAVARHLGKLLSSFGIESDWKTAAEAAPR